MMKNCVNKFEIEADLFFINYKLKCCLYKDILYAKINIWDDAGIWTLVFRVKNISRQDSEDDGYGQTLVFFLSLLMAMCIYPFFKYLLFRLGSFGVMLFLGVRSYVRHLSYRLLHKFTLDGNNITRRCDTWRTSP